MNINFDLNKVKFDDNGLIPAIIQHFETKEILMLAYMNKESLIKTIELKEAVFWSRSRKEIWHKGATSGNYIKIKNILIDCDADTLIIFSDITGNSVCHTGTRTCFINPDDNLARAIF
ncbi:MAG: phosphoribosyl-AMP cyclohydrolase [Dehalococcoidia bacterium]|jgi:phosphoribosyl-AMP cyclohydrolase|nr:MAG: phosphoribosyl-AMP cyclohydrolase [Chloroflexota bacterium]|tara:strand:+ start:3777 stop:4130 length:354 start_codon:yes stop_codon:yes gene_type:complete